MDFIDLKAQQAGIRDRLDANMRKVLAHGQYILGPEVKELEGKLAAYAGRKYAVGCASGTDALLMALMALGVGPGDAVFTTPFTFISTAEVISLLGATPIYVDIDPGTYNIDPDKLEQAIVALKTGDDRLAPLPRIEGVEKLRPKAVIPVDMLGLMADYAAIGDIARKHGLTVIEDAAQSFGAVYKGRKACAFGDIACTSFFPAKPLGCYGDGGMIFTDDPNLASMLESIRAHGKGSHKYDNVRIGINGRLDTLQAAIVLAKFEVFPEEMEKRQEVARRYTEAIRGIPGIETPFVPEGYRSAWAQYSLLARDEAHRSFLQKGLQEQGIPTMIYYPRPLHLQTAFAFLGYREGDCPASEDCAVRTFSLPMHPYLAEEQQDFVVKALRERSAS
ncbi:MAG: aminotransferase DegT [Deltaproteobacteria bacterium HGW-Deltaproteobacteria-19]|jgi:dTDP-4-amino-4,6-dideoxygalactose transaminase|nr:MAG: aminotransferase DegT [Deltaproteobacteria bacterium HGW-Deltaproteobacteria-19]